MGVYLSTPNTEKNSCDESCKRFTYGASCMQGWRMTQEDAHNCLPEFDDNSALFAVYDGHGGAEVAQYCATNFPKYIKDLSTYKDGKYSEALEEAFLGFDALLKTPDVIKELKILAGVESDDEEDQEDKGKSGQQKKTEAELLRQEADMPIEDLMAKYESSESAPQSRIRILRKKGHANSPVIKPKKMAFPSDGNKLSDDDKKSLDSDTKSDDKISNGHAENENNINLEKESKMSNVSSSSTSVQQDTVSSSADNPSTSLPTSSASDSSIASGEITGSSSSTLTSSSSTITGSSQDTSAVSSADSLTEPCSSSGSKSSSKPPVCGSSTDTAGGSSSNSSVGSSALSDKPGGSSGGSKDKDEALDDDDDDEEDEDFNADLDDSDEEEDDDEDFEMGEDSDEDLVDEDDNDEDDVDDEEADFEETESFAKTEEPGSDSGTTAVVALVKDKQVFVANAGDSRCVLCRGGKAIDLSEDHKPEDEIERNRVEAAGGKVTQEGRINGGLNLSRAIGDHFYKRNPDKSDREQMITALPDIETATLQENDEFMVLACDGIWNYMSSQEVVDFVKEKMKEEENRKKLSLICEQLFDKCLAPNTLGDGTGCDNMTCIIVTFDQIFNNNKNNKRPAEDTEERLDKRQKTDEPGT